jgi:branched-chain amino acid transport system substrate-binding protein
MAESSKTTKILVIVISVVLLVVGIVVGYEIPRSSSSSSPTGLSGNVPIGVLLPLTGDFASYGATAQVVAGYAENQINTYVSSVGLPYNFTFYTMDTQTNPSVALKDVQLLASKGVQVITGLIDSSDVLSIEGYANANHIVIISSFSTTAGIGGGYIFRTVPHDTAEGIALADLVYGKGYKYVALLTREDSCDMDISGAFMAQFKSLGGVILTNITYPGGTSDFSSQISALSSVVGPAVAKYGNNSVAIQTLTWSDVATLLSQAKSENSNILNVNWFGGDGATLSSTITTNAGAIAAQVHFLSPMYAAPNTSILQSLNNYVETKLKVMPDIYSIILYDSLWIAALSIMEAGVNNGQVIKNVVPYVCDHYFGASGWTELANNSNDRAGLNIEFYEVEQVTTNNYNWVLAATFDSTTQTVTWIS